MTRACAHMLYVRSHICLYMLYMFPCTLYIGVAGCQARASGDFAGGSHASSQVRNRIRFNNYHYVYLHIYYSPILWIRVPVRGQPCKPYTHKVRKARYWEFVCRPPPQIGMSRVYFQQAQGACGADAAPGDFSGVRYSMYAHTLLHINFLYYTYRV